MQINKDRGRGNEPNYDCICAPVAASQDLKTRQDSATGSLAVLLLKLGQDNVY